MKRLIKKAENAYFLINFNPASLVRPNTEKLVEKIPATSELLATEFKNWYVQNWINEGKDVNGLKYVGNLPKELFRGWVNNVSYQFSGLSEPLLDQSEFLLQSERVLK